MNENWYPLFIRDNPVARDLYDRTHSFCAEQQRYRIEAEAEVARLRRENARLRSRSCAWKRAATKWRRAARRPR